MRCSRSRLLVGAAVACLALAAVGARGARAITIDFESVGGPGCATFPGSTPLVTQGFTFLGAGDPAALLVCDNSTDPSVASNGSRYLISGAEPIGGQAPIAMLEGTGGGAGLPFSLLAFDATELSADTPGDAVRVTGYDATLTDVIADVTLVFDGSIDGPGGVDDFETFALPASFQTVWGVAWEGVDQGSGTKFYAIDNVVVVPIPEPSSRLRVGLGLAAAGVHRRRATAARATRRGR
jgi:hypothetical protein